MRLSRQILWIFIPALCVATPAFGQAQNDEAPAAKVDPQAQTVLGAFCKQLEQVETLRFDAVTNFRFVEPGRTRTGRVTGQLLLNQPNRFRVIAQDIDFRLNDAPVPPQMLPKAVSVVCDGENVHAFLPNVPAPPSRPAAPNLQQGLASAVLGGLPAPPASLFLQLYTSDLFGQQNLREQIAKGELTLKYGGLEELDAAPCHKLEVVSKVATILLWIENAEAPVLRKAMLSGGPPEARVKNGVKIEAGGPEVVETYSNWEVIGTLPPDAFTVDAVKAQLAKLPPQKAPTHPLIAKPAPAKKLPLLAQGEFDLARHKDKQIVVLDFWATWCPPCRLGLPILAKIADAYKDKGVVLYAINVDEPADKIREFLESSKLTLTVPLDKGGELAQQYRVTSIPQTVIINRAGTVRHVHIGVPPDYETTLRSELDGLLADKPD